MKESNNLAANAGNNSLKREILLNTKGKYMKESNTLAGNAAKNSLKRDILLYTKRKYMKLSNNLVGKSHKTPKKSTYRFTDPASQKVCAENKYIKCQPSCAWGNCSPPATQHQLQNPKWQTGSGEAPALRFSDAPSNFAK